MEKITVEFAGRYLVLVVPEAWTLFVCEGRIYRRNKHGVFVFKGFAPTMSIAAA